ncbi:MAG: ABC transporter permease [Leeuwenhoekiella sp.]|uniref:ABC transporter permease n=1 Tax=Leeuwenhoekiella sp. MAR_2009_132 TaxID=1392489 RepID=UPI00048BDF18|nr:FtsX-like permease family protein [Leeuwenhoekiella sp. MAR_2009_132]MDP5044324.1 ABC transporter permease [Leeuwenhoekiella sp.]
MNFEYFTAKRIIGAKKYKSTASTPIIKIAIIAIILGMVMMMITIATGVGLQQKIREKVSAFNGDIIISQFDGNNSDITLNPIPKDQPFYPQFTAVPDVSHIQATATKAGVIRTPTDFEGIIVKGVGADYRWDYMKDFLIEGRIPDYNAGLNTEILVSNYQAKRLGFKNGDKVIVFFLKEDGGFLNRRFDIVGIYDSGFQEFDESFLFADIRHVQKLNKWDDNQVGAFEVFVSDFDRLDAIGNEVFENTGSFLNSMTITKKYYSIFEWLSLFDFNIALIIVVMIIVAGINMIVALLVLILERTPMVGILKALGASNWSIRKIFMYNALYLVGIGLFWGNIIGIGLLLLQKYLGIITLNPETYYVSEAPVYIDWYYIVLLNVGTFILCAVMLLVPSYVITRISPVKTIKFN